jgi:hypothetical protein
MVGLVISFRLCGFVTALQYAIHRPIAYRLCGTTEPQGTYTHTHTHIYIYTYIRCRQVQLHTCMCFESGDVGRFPFAQVWFKTGSNALLYNLHDRQSNPNQVLFINLAEQAMYVQNVTL